MWAKWVDNLSASGLVAENDRILAAVSGGADSVFLLRLLLAFREKSDVPFSLEVAHVNHQLRGESAEADALFVKRLAETYKLPFHLRRVDVQAYRKKAGRGLEDAARQLRYGALLEVCRDRGLNKMALGHHADDQVETLVQRFLQGTGLQGLRGMEERTDYQGITLIRPLLSMWKSEILQFCRDERLGFRQDESNFSMKYTRNKIRLSLIPLLETYNPQFKRGLLDFSRRIKDEDDYLQSAAHRLFTQAVCQKERGWEIDIPAFLTEHLALQRRVLRIILKYLLPDRILGQRHVEVLMHVIGAKEPAAEIDLPGEIKARRVYQKLIIQPAESDGSRVQPYHCRLEVPGRLHLHQAGWIVETHLEAASEMPRISKPKNRFEAYFDWDMMQNNGPLVVRTRMDGDRVALFGLNGAKKVKDIFIDAKVPRLLRDNYPIVSQGETILWVPGLARSRYYLVHETSRQILIIRLYNMK